MCTNIPGQPDRGPCAQPSIGSVGSNPHVQIHGGDTHIEYKGGEKGLVKKPTGFMSSSRYIIQELDRKCAGDHDQVPLVGGRAAGAEIYPQALGEAISRGTETEEDEPQ